MVELNGSRISTAVTLGIFVIFFMAVVQSCRDLRAEEQALPLVVDLVSGGFRATLRTKRNARRERAGGDSSVGDRIRGA